MSKILDTILGSGMASLSLLAIFPPPTRLFWKISVVVKEKGHFAVPFCLVLASLPQRHAFFRDPASLLFIFAAISFATPLIRAYRTGFQLQRAYANIFGPDDSAGAGELRKGPLRFSELWFGVKLPRIDPQRLIYAVYGDESLGLDFYPTKVDDAPCIIVIHGGGWDSGNGRDMPELNRYLSARGYAVASMDYRLSPKHTYPAQLEDVSNAIEYLRFHSKELRIDTERLVLLGRSAGGQIALRAGYGHPRPPGVRAVVSFYAPADMIFGWNFPCPPLILDSRKVMKDYLGGTYSEQPERYIDSSPVEILQSDAPPTLLLHGRPDVVVAYAHTLRLESKLQRLGVPHFTVDLPWAAHGYDYFFSGPGSQLGLYFLDRFLARATR